ncbi:helix-turn-helix domain-containing protein [Pseudonocardia sp. CA-107938]|uniref:helix-turn-helix domain-containing protein n=1 Tax=Pseudonocardia sp. CA-107938 TaxID=3240021 RepID=UPI003D915A40
MRNGTLVRKRMLGRRLRRLREEAGLTLEAAAPALDWSTSTLSRIETGQQAPSVHSIRSMLDLYGAGGPIWDELVTLTRQVRQRGWWRAYGLGDDSYVGFETEATSVLDYTIDYIPGLLQTADYSRALFAASIANRSAAEITNAVSVRMIRQERLSSPDHPLELTAIVDESALYRRVGGTAVLEDQLRHLINMAGLRAVTLQVLPMATGARAAMGSGLMVLSFGELGEPDMVYIEHALGATHTGKGNAAAAKLMFDRLRSDALSPADSVALIQRLVER